MRIPLIIVHVVNSFKEQWYKVHVVVTRVKRDNMDILLVT